jgi:hypothetical protein
VNSTPSGKRGSTPRISGECSICFVQREVRRASPSPFLPSFFGAGLLETRPPLRKAHSASVSRWIRNRSTPAASMINSLWPSQKTSVSINQAAGRRHMEHSLTLMGLTSKQRGARSLATPPRPVIQFSLLRGGPLRLSLIHSLDELCQDPKVRDLIDPPNAEIIENSVKLSLRNLRS